MSERVEIFDTTLRDGEQSPGASLTSEQKVIIARQLDVLGVDIIEAGFPVSSQEDFRSVRAVAESVKRATVCGLARALEKDITAAGKALKRASRKRIHTFIATSPVHMKYKLRMSREEVLANAVRAVKLAGKYCGEVEFSCEDASRSERKFLVKIIEEVIKAGAKIINIPDTVGYSYPSEMEDLVRFLIENVRGSEKVIFSVHCHNDLGLATANSISSVLAGARQVECTINGIGERAGNAAMEEIVMALKVRFPQFKTGINTKQIFRTSRLVSNLTGVFVQQNKAIVGKNAFAHESGIHQDGVIKKAQTYEIIKPQDVGISGSTLVLGKHSGRAALLKRARDLGFKLSQRQLNKVFAEFKRLADKKKNVYDDDIVALLEKDFGGRSSGYELESFEVVTGKLNPIALVKLKKAGKIFTGTATGDGPVDSALKAIDSISGKSGKLLDYFVNAITKGKDAQGEVRLTVQFNGEKVSGISSSTDIIEASILAYISALNKVVGAGRKKK
ncbi:MAG: 2-isopropylmalate synthase [Elusimicrobia bacterium]|nr:2-isopropylmalate synthase [Elusimicrobiota bacterium]